MDKKFVFSVGDVADILNLSKDFTYTLFQAPDFPAMLIGNKLCVRGDKFDAWVNQQTPKQIRRNRNERQT